MAFTSSYVSAKSGKTFGIYNIDWSVGRIGSNLHDDVMLVQALLRIFYYELEDAAGPGYEPPPGESGIDVDGWIGKHTQAHITQFQTQMKAKGYNIMQDGIFDPYRVHSMASTVSKTIYTIDFLNNGCANLCDQKGLNNYDNLANRQDIPQQLRNALKTVKKTANKYKYG